MADGASRAQRLHIAYLRRALRGLNYELSLDRLQEHSSLRSVGWHPLG